MKARNTTTQHNSSNEERKAMGEILACVFDAMSDPDSEFYKEEK